MRSSTFSDAGMRADRWTPMSASNPDKRGVCHFGQVFECRLTCRRSCRIFAGSREMAVGINGGLLLVARSTMATGSSKGSSTLSCG